VEVTQLIVCLGGKTTIEFKFVPTEVKDYTDAVKLKAPDGSVLQLVELKGKGVTSAPQVSGFTPTSGAEGTAVTITGGNFTGATGVKFGGVSASFTENSDTQITATVPSGAVSSAIEVVTPAGGAASSAQFDVLNPPVIYTFQPSYGGQCSTVTVYGENLDGAYFSDGWLFDEHRFQQSHRGKCDGLCAAWVLFDRGGHPNGTVTTENVGYFYVTSEYGGSSLTWIFIFVLETEK
jgi:hypothetical protein